jgi:hypothetical protein
MIGQPFDFAVRQVGIPSPSWTRTGLRSAAATEEERPVGWWLGERVPVVWAMTDVDNRYPHHLPPVEKTSISYHPLADLGGEHPMRCALF